MKHKGFQWSPFRKCFVKTSATCRLVPMYCNRNGSHSDRSKIQSSTTLRVRETCLVAIDRFLKTIFITASLSSKTIKKQIFEIKLSSLFVFAKPESPPNFAASKPESHPNPASPQGTTEAATVTMYSAMTVSDRGDPARCVRRPKCDSREGLGANTNIQSNDFGFCA